MMRRAVRIQPTLQRSPRSRPTKPSKQSHNSARFFGTASVSGREHERLGRHGDTLLHDLVAKFKNMEDFHRGVADIPRETLVKMSLTTNHQGCTPFDFIPSYAQSELKVYIYELMASQKVSKLADPVVSYLEDNKDPVVNQNANVALAAATFARSIIRKSSSHPEINSYTRAEANKLWDEVDGSSLTQNLIGRHPNPVRNAAMIAKEYRLGNCERFAYLALDFVQEFYPQCRGDIVSIVKGDHFMLVIDDRDVKVMSDVSHSAVICDAWAGSVFLRSQESHLGVRKYYELNKQDNGINVICSYSPIYHKLKTVYSSTSSDEENRLRARM